MLQFELKFDPERPYHYIITVGVQPLHSKRDAGKLFLKYRPVHFTNEDVEKVQHALLLSNDKLFKTTKQEAIKACDCEDLVYTLTSMRLGANMNNCSMHHFSSDTPMDEGDFDILVDLANKSEHSKQLLLKSIIRG